MDRAFQARRFVENGTDTGTSSVLERLWPWLVLSHSLLRLVRFIARSGHAGGSPRELQLKCGQDFGLARKRG